MYYLVLTLASLYGRIAYGRAVERRLSTYVQGARTHTAAHS